MATSSRRNQDRVCEVVGRLEEAFHETVPDNGPEPMSILSVSFPVVRLQRGSGTSKFYLRQRGEMSHGIRKH